jgi:hypothetical protein
LSRRPGQRPRPETHPLALIAVLKHELPGFDEARAARIVSEFEHDKAGFCRVWASAAHLKGQGITLDKDCRRPK